MVVEARAEAAAVLGLEKGAEPDARRVTVRPWSAVSRALAPGVECGTKSWAEWWVCAKGAPGVGPPVPKAHVGRGGGHSAAHWCGAGA